MMRIINQWLDVPAAGPDDARRRKLLNIVLSGLDIIALVVLVVTIVDNDLSDPHILADSLPVLLGGLVWLVGSAIMFVINRYGSGRLASSIFLLLLTIVIAFSDLPEQVTNGRGVSLFAVPILMASFLLGPLASFAMSGLSGVVITAISLSMLQTAPPWTSVIALFSIALASWLSARGMERALQDVRILNRELDQRVADRTRDLAQALAREQVELNKSQAVLEGIADGVIVFDNQGQAIVANPAISRLLDKPPEAIVHSDIETLMARAVSDADRETVINLLTDKESHHPGVKLQWGAKTLSASFASVRDATGDTIGTVAVFRDFTREAEIDRMKTSLVSMVSHDLRTPLSAIMGYAEMLQESIYGPLSEKQYGTVERIIANGKRLMSLVNDLLDQAQIEAGKLALRITTFNPVQLVEGVQSGMSVLAQSKGLELTAQIAPDVPTTLQGDPQRLLQILANLVSNSLKFTEQGRVQLRLYRPDSTHWAMEVSDTGPGIPPDKLDSVYERFHQLDELETRRYTGVGLGLSIVKQLVTLMNGEVKVKSVLGEGTTFTVVLPLVNNPQEVLQ
jgi:signal transduction histidine kinase